MFQRELRKTCSLNLKTERKLHEHGNEQKECFYQYVNQYKDRSVTLNIFVTNIFGDGGRYRDVSAGTYKVDTLPKSDKLMLNVHFLNSYDVSVSISNVNNSQRGY